MTTFHHLQIELDTAFTLWVWPYQKLMLQQASCIASAQGREGGREGGRGEGGREGRERGKEGRRKGGRE